MLSVCSCHERKYDTDLSLEYFSEISSERYSVDNSLLKEKIHHLILSDRDKSELDVFVRKYYKDYDVLLWVTRNGINSKADTLLKYLNDVRHIGFNPEKFYYSQIRNDIKTLRNLDFNDTDNINSVIARLEYYMTKAYVRYCTGQRYGFVNPAILYNTLEKDDSDTTNTRFIRLYDIPMQHPDRTYYNEAFRKILNDSIGVFLGESSPQNRLYDVLVTRLDNIKDKSKIKYICNIERARWRLSDYPGKYKKYVFINIPSQTLEAVDGDERIPMKIIFGKTSTKTPLLISKINRIDFNPKWIIPQSIIRKDVVKHVDDIDYFIRNNFYVTEKKTGEVIDLSDVTKEMLLSNDYRVIQEGGSGNSLGRVIFRFNNNFSVFLHDTSSPNVFTRTDRRASHGCIRVEKPFELAVFMLHEKEDNTIERIKYSMTNDNHVKEQSEKRNTHKVKTELALTDAGVYLSSLKINPTVPLFITYYTVYPVENSGIREYNDIYGYDQVIYDHLKRFM